jgi:hypothetical protein
LQLGKSNIPDCTLLAHAESQVLELYTDEPEQCLEVMETFLERCPNTLAFVLYQQMVRRYTGISEARAVFPKARRVLKETETQDDTKQAKGGEETKQEDAKDAGEVSVATSQNGNRRMVRASPLVTGNSRTSTVKIQDTQLQARDPQATTQTALW